MIGGNGEHSTFGPILNFENFRRWFLPGKFPIRQIHQKGISVASVSVARPRAAPRLKTRRLSKSELNGPLTITVPSRSRLRLSGLVVDLNDGGFSAAANHPLRGGRWGNLQRKYRDDEKCCEFWEVHGTDYSVSVGAQQEKKHFRAAFFGLSDAVLPNSAIALAVFTGTLR